jgi:hypothetical protein
MKRVDCRRADPRGRGVSQKLQILPVSFSRSSGLNHRFVASHWALVMSRYIWTNVSFPIKLPFEARYNVRQRRGESIWCEVEDKRGSKSCSAIGVVTAGTVRAELIGCAFAEFYPAAGSTWWARRASGFSGAFALNGEMRVSSKNWE